MNIAALAAGRPLSFRFRAGRGPAIEINPVQRRIVDEVERLLGSGRYTLAPTSCICGERDATAVSELDRYGLSLRSVMCRGCGTLRFDPYPQPADIADFYTRYYQDMYGRAPDEPSYFARQRGYGERLLAAVEPHLRPGATVLEVGCGAGGALDVFRARGFAAHGCDFSARLIAYGRAQGLSLVAEGEITAACEQLGLAPGSIDLLYLHHVFEHLAEPVAWLREAARYVAAGGCIIVAVPDVAEIDRHPSPGGDLRGFLHIAHKYNFTLAGLLAGAAGAGLQAAPVAVRRSSQAPEMWVAFGRAAPALPLQDGLWRGSAAALRRRLRRIELQYLTKAALRKVGAITGARR